MSNMTVSVSPHIKDNASTTTIMRDVLIALVPALIASVLIFGFRAFVVTAVCVVFAVGGEWAFEKTVKKPNTIGDLSAVVTGVLLAYNLPVGIPLWQAAFGSLVAIIVVKQLFGGIGQNFANPAITARIIMLIAFSQTMTTWAIPNAISGATDVVSSATPLVLLKGTEGSGMLPSLTNMILGVRGGCLGETSAIALVIGGIYLLVRRVISWHTPVAFIGTVLLLTFLLGKQPEYQLLSGGLLIGAFFMATDYSTTPNTDWGRIIFGVGCGLITVLIRVWGNYPEGVSFSILLMNILTPYISKATRKKPLGGVKA
ncbi:MAG: RnfABCDGE type electron transport complex subunit D [Oscillospiraceae bacterium]|nr:RnfABCDGE type electron transport complex subunit D [Oscillospiraceae bacterium]